MTRNLVCEECGGNLQDGFIVEHAHGNILDFPYWVKGKPELSWFGYIKTKGKEKYNMKVYRCERCGFMKFYAGPDHS